MKTTGMVRKINPLGRIVIPAQLRKFLDISIGDSMEIFIEENKVILKKYMAQRICGITGIITEENVESHYIKDFYLSPQGAEILLKVSVQ